MRDKILIIDGHPDPAPQRFCHALADAYVNGARASGLETRLITVADADIPLLRTAKEFAELPTQRDVIRARDDIMWSNHIVFIFPLWLGGAPALLHAFLEHVARDSFVAETRGRGIHQKLKGRSAHLIVTMGMPALMYSVLFKERGVRNLMQGVLGFGGVKPIRRTYFGAMEAASARVQTDRIEQVRGFGRNGS